MKPAVPLLLVALAGMALSGCSGSPAVSGAPRGSASSSGLSSSSRASSGSGSTGQGAAGATVSPPATGSPSGTARATGSAAASPRPTPTGAAAHFTRTTLYRGPAHPDDLAIDSSGRLLFSDYTNGTISRLNADGSVTVLHRGLAGPEGLVPLAGGTLVVAEEKTNRIVSFAPGSDTAHLLRTIPGNPTLVECHQGVDGIAWDPTTRSLVIPDAPTGTIYRLSTDGRTLTKVATGFTHPVGATVDGTGAIYVADECGGDVWKVTAGSGRTRVAPASMPDDAALDGLGNIIVTDVRHVRHSVTRTNLRTGATTTLASAGLVEPQGLVFDRTGAIYVSDDIANVIIRLTPSR